MERDERKWKEVERKWKDVERAWEEANELEVERAWEETNELDVEETNASGKRPNARGKRRTRVGRDEREWKEAERAWEESNVRGALRVGTVTQSATVNYRLGTPVMISISANSLVVDENTRE